MTPLCSVIIPAYKQPELLKQAIESVLKQTYNNIEIVVVNDDTTMDIWNIIKPYLSNNFTFIQNPYTTGVSASRNQGIRQAKGEYIALLDQDDYYVYDKIENSVKFLELYNCGMMHHNATIVNQRCIWLGGGDEWDIKYLLTHKPGKCRNLLYRNYICNSTPVIKRECFDKVGLFDEQLFISADWDMWLRIEEHFSIGYLDMSLSYIRSYPKDIFI